MLSLDRYKYIILRYVFDGGFDSQTLNSTDFDSLCYFSNDRQENGHIIVHYVTRAVRSTLTLSSGQTV